MKTLHEQLHDDAVIIVNHLSSPSARVTMMWHVWAPLQCHVWVRVATFLQDDTEEVRPEAGHDDTHETLGDITSKAPVWTVFT